ncbi:hypothetical protein, partial [Acidovorax sp. K2F]|uniref:hypothetical protein n=1 Tax=Acidovorax sp. K2F TaxID=2978125 RepID=UPI0021B0A26A
YYAATVLLARRESGDTEKIFVAIATDFIYSNSKAIHLPLGLRLTEDVHEVEMRADGDDLVFSHLRNSWHGFLSAGYASVTTFCLSERPSNNMRGRKPRQVKHLSERAEMVFRRQKSRRARQG